MEEHTSLYFQWKIWIAQQEDHERRNLALFKRSTIVEILAKIKCCAMNWDVLIKRELSMYVNYIWKLGEPIVFASGKHNASKNKIFSEGNRLSLT